MELDTCKEKLDETLFQDLQTRLFGVGYVGNIDEEMDYFWIFNRMSMFMNSRGGYVFHSVRKFQGNLIKNGDETLIVGDFKIIPILKIWWSIMYTFFGLILIYILYIDISIGESFKSIMLFLLVMLGMIIFGAGIIKFSISRGEKAEKDTLEFLNSLLEVYKVEVEEE